MEEVNKKDIENKENKFLNFFKALVPYIIILVVVLIIRLYIATPIVVNGPSMQPTLDGGEIMILNKLAKIDRNDVVVVKIPDEEIIKRVIALPGETISCTGGIIYVNDHKVTNDLGSGVTSDFPRIKLGSDEYFVMGDNRPNSLDSRVLGPFKRSQIKGEAKLVLFPFNKIGNIK